MSDGAASGPWPEIAGDPRFFRGAGPQSLAAVAAAAGGVAPSDDGLRLLDGVAPLQTAGPTQVSFLDNRRYAAVLEATQAGVVIVHPDLAAKVPATTVAVVTGEPYVGWARVAALFYPRRRRSPLAYIRRR